jgi:hypothetical protein
MGISVEHFRRNFQSKKLHGSLAHTGRPAGRARRRPKTGFGTPVKERYQHVWIYAGYIYELQVNVVTSYGREGTFQYNTGCFIDLEPYARHGNMYNAQAERQCTQLC